MATGLWTDYRASSFAGGSGTSSSPYLISTPAQLAYLEYLINNGSNTSFTYYKITANLDMSAHYWKPIGSTSHIFKGEINGQYYKISNLSIDKPNLSNDTYLGLVGYTSQCNIKQLYIKNWLVNDNSTADSSFLIGGTIGDVNISSISIDSDSQLVWESNSSTTTSQSGTFGSLIGTCIGSTIYTVNIDNCNIEDSQFRSSKGCLGGLIGNTGSAAKVNISNINLYIGEWYSVNTSAYIGGLIGHAYIHTNNNINISYISIYYNDVYLIHSPLYIGGLIGYARVRQSSNYQTKLVINHVFVDYYNYLSGDIKAYIGGWEGKAPNDSTIPSHMSNLYYPTKERLLSNNNITSGIFSSTENTNVVTSNNFSAYNGSDTYRLVTPYTNDSYTNMQNIYFNAYNAACRRFTVDYKLTTSGSIYQLYAVVLSDMYLRDHDIYSIRVVYLLDTASKSQYDFTQKIYYITTEKFEVPLPDKYTYLNTRWNEQEMKSSNKWFGDSEGTSNGDSTSNYYNAGDKISLSTDMILFSENYDDSKLISYKKDSSTTVGVEDIYYKTNSSTTKIVNNYKYKKDSSTIV